MLGHKYGDFNPWNLLLGDGSLVLLDPGLPSSSTLRVENEPGVVDDVAFWVQQVASNAHRLARARVMERHVISSWDALLDYCRTAMAHAEVEQFRVLYLDKKNTLIRDEAQAKGTVDHVPVYPREVLKRALTLNASAMILVHNHPSGDPTPSDADIAVTRQISDGCRALGLTLHDHLIIGKSSETSFRSAGLLTD